MRKNLIMLYKRSKYVKTLATLMAHDAFAVNPGGKVVFMQDYA